MLRVLSDSNFIVWYGVLARDLVFGSFDAQMEPIKRVF